MSLTNSKDQLPNLRHSRSLSMPYPLLSLSDIPKVDRLTRQIRRRKVEVNIPLLDAIKQILRYAKFLKELCTHKGRLKGNEKISLSRTIFALI